MNDIVSTMNLETISSELRAKEPLLLESWEPVNATMVRHWCEVLGLDFVRYENSGYAPATMLHVWTMPGYRGAFPGGSTVDMLRQASNRLAACGFTGVMAVAVSQRFFRRLRMGERLSRKVFISAVSSQKTTAAGEGVFVTEDAEVFSRGEIIGKTRLTLLCFRPPKFAKEARANQSPARVLDTSGLPYLDLTTRFVTAAAIATRDFEDVHLDARAAQSAGLKDIYLNIMTTLGLMERSALALNGPASEIRQIDAKLLAPAFPGDRLHFRATHGSSGELKVELFTPESVHASATLVTA